MDTPPQTSSIPNALTPSLREPQASRALGLMATADRHTPSIPRPRPEPTQDARPAGAGNRLPAFSHEVQQNLPQIPEGASVGSGLGPLTGPGGGAGVREQLGRAAWGGQARCARDPPVQGRPRQDGAAAAGHRRSLSVHPQPRPRPSSPTLPARPFQQNVTMHKDSTGHVGFVIKKGKLISSVKGSSVARNGLLINHYVCEVNGQNVLGLKDKEVTEILATAGNVTNLTIIPTVIYEHMVRKLSPALLHHTVDHSIADI
ncbi:syntenin-2 isoform X8 [Physeter macrocephalus]|uniref:Syntenin-2 isoform X8 n=1 Tax=Physeter macrocephalus TaxID=9755 RepID=A0A9W2X5M5_PHYMC|nr:syntenin-2 isoform X8 [Physeter catodon]